MPIPATIAVFGGAWQETTVRALSGASRYAAEHPGLKVLNLLCLQDVTSHLAIPILWKGRAQGVITVVGPFDGDISTAQWILQGGVPAVSLTFDWFHPGIPALNTSPGHIAELAVGHLLDCGCRAFGFVGHDRSRGSAMRRDAFRKVLAGLDQPEPDVVESTDNFTGTAEDEFKVPRQLDLADMLTRAAKPLGILAINDKTARIVGLVCRDLGLRVPEDVGIVGVNDTVLSRTGTPPITSIAVDGDEIGYRAAKALHAMIQGQPVSARIEVPALGLIPRQSTIGSLVASEEVRQAREFIRKNAGEGLTVDQVADAVNLSRTALELLFRKAVGQPPGKEIQQTRLDYARQLLTETDLTISQVSQMLGFAESAAFSKFFRRLAGSSPRAYRQRLATTALPEAI
jgi:LacI family transcriptional regulator